MTAERVYEELRDILQSGSIAPGARLEPGRLAARLTSSATPVRDALHRLAGERLVEMRTSDGFHLPLLNEAILGDLYRWNDELMKIALRHRRRAVASVEGGVRPGEAASVFAAIGEATRSTVISMHIASANSMLAVARRAESNVLTGVEEEVSEIWHAFSASSKSTRLSLMNYHKRRMLHIGQIIKSTNQQLPAFK